MQVLAAGDPPEDPAEDAVWVAAMLALVEQAVEIAVVANEGTESSVSDRWATFDCYGTLIDWEGGIRAAMSAMWPDADPDALLRRHHAVEPLVQEGAVVDLPRGAGALSRGRRRDRGPPADPAAAFRARRLAALVAGVRVRCRRP